MKIVLNGIELQNKIPTVPGLYFMTYRHYKNNESDLWTCYIYKDGGIKYDGGNYNRTRIETKTGQLKKEYKDNFFFSQKTIDDLVK